MAGDAEVAHMELPICKPAQAVVAAAVAVEQAAGIAKAEGEVVVEQVVVETVHGVHCLLVCVEWREHFGRQISVSVQTLVAKMAL